MDCGLETETVVRGWSLVRVIVRAAVMALAGQSMERGFGGVTLVIDTADVDRNKSGSMRSSLIAVGRSAGRHGRVACRE